MITAVCQKCGGSGYTYMIGFTDRFTCRGCFGKGEVLPQIVPLPNDRRFQEVSPIDHTWRPLF